MKILDKLNDLFAISKGLAKKYPVESILAGCALLYLMAFGVSLTVPLITGFFVGLAYTKYEK